MKFPAFAAIALKNNLATVEILDLPMNEVAPNPHQPRKHFNEDALLELSHSIKLYGVIQPIIVKRNGQAYQIIAGERRWRAAKLADQLTIPAIVHSNNEKENVAIAIIENVQREQLNPIELAESFQQLTMDYGFSHEAIGKMVGKNRSTVSNLLRLLNLVPEVRHLVITGDLEMGHARVLVSLMPALQLETALQVISKQLSVRQTEALVKKNKTYKNKELSHYAEEMESCAETLATLLSSKVKIQINAHGAGHVIIKIESLEEIHALIARFAGNNTSS